MARPKAKAAPRFVEPEDESRDQEDQQWLEAEEPDTSGMRMSKTDAIRAAMAQGIESPGDGVDFIRKRFGMEMSKGHFSATKSKLKSTEAAQKPAHKAAPKASAPKASAAKAAVKGRPGPVQDSQTPPEQPVSHSGNLLDALEQMKPLIAQYGVDGIKRMADLLG